MAEESRWKATPLRWKIFAITAPITIALDQITKVWARASLEVAPNGVGIPVAVIENYWDWRLSQNPGSAFGLFNSTSGARIFLSIIGVIAVAAIVWMVRKARDDQRRFRSRQLDQQFFRSSPALASFTSARIVLKCAVTCCFFCNRSSGGRRQRGASQVGVQDYTSGVYYTTETKQSFMRACQPKPLNSFFKQCFP